MRFNSRQREEPYPDLTSPKGSMASRNGGLRKTGVAWLSSARVVRCWVKSRNERNPYRQLPAVRPGTLAKLPPTRWRKVGMTSSQHGPYVRGYTRNTMASTKGCETARWSQSQKARLSSDWGLQPDPMKSESRALFPSLFQGKRWFPGLVHTDRHMTDAVVCTRSRLPNPQGGELSTVWREAFGSARNPKKDPLRIPTNASLLRSKYDRHRRT